MYAHTIESPQNDRARAWLEGVLNAPSRVGFPWPTLLAFVRLMGNGRVVREPVPLRQSWARVQAWVALPQAWIPIPTDRHGKILNNLLDGETRSELINDAHLAALSIEHGLTICSTDRDFARFPGVRWENPLSSETPRS